MAMVADSTGSTAADTEGRMGATRNGLASRRSN